MCDQLACEAIEQIGVLVVADIIEIDEASNDIIVKPLLRLYAPTKAYGLLLISPKILNQQIPLNRRIVDA